MNERWSLSRRSSIASSLTTGLIGWNGFVVLAALALGYDGAPWTLFGAATIGAIVEVVVVRTLMLAICIDWNVKSGAIAGAAFGAVAYGAARICGFDLVRANPIAWALALVSMAGAVGAFLAYFERDDRALEAKTPRGPSRYGRDAHWLEPFGFGAIAYALAYGPRDASFIAYVVVVGAVSGVVAAGVSHFSPDAWKRTAVGWLAALAVGAGQGVIAGWLLRRGFALGVLGGVMTYAVTFARGRALAAREEKEAL
jgi:hypothetical protein